MKITKKVILISLTAAFHGNLSAADLTNAKVCAITNKNTRNAVLLSARSAALMDRFDLGPIESGDKRDAPDFISAREKFTLIISPRTVVLDDYCSMSACIEKTEVKPRCQGTREYLLTVGVNPRKFAPGAFTSDIEIRLFDEKREYPVERTFKFMFASQISGTIYMPRAEIVQRAETSTALTDLLNGNKGKAVLELINTGNRPLKLGNWDKDDQIDGTLNLESSTCQNRVLDTGETCSLEVRNLEGKKSSVNYVFWANHHYQDASDITLYLTRRITGGIDYNIKNN